LLAATITSARNSSSPCIRVGCLTLLPPPGSPLFPYTTLFRSILAHRQGRHRHHRGQQQIVALVEFTHADPESGAHHIGMGEFHQDRKSTRLNSSHSQNSYAVFCLKKKTCATHPTHEPPRRTPS